MTGGHEKWMTEAIALAVENVRSGRGGPFGAVVVKNDRIIASGVNLVTATNDPTAHSEILAIRAACHALGAFELQGCELYSTCEPCPMCIGAIYWARPAAYYFACTRLDAAQAGFDDASIYHQLNLAPERRSIRSHQVLLDDGLAPFIEWAHSSKKIAY
jgi:guanine deaminase